MLSGKIEGDPAPNYHADNDGYAAFYGDIVYNTTEQLQKIANERKRAMELGFYIGRHVSRKNQAIAGVGKIINFATDVIKGWGCNKPAPIIVQWGEPGSMTKYDMNYNSDDLILVEDKK